MEHGLMPYHDNVQSLALMGGPSHAARRLFASNEGDLVIGIAFPRYVEDTIELARRAAGHGARVLALTDSPRSPLAQFADSRSTSARTGGSRRMPTRPCSP